MSMNEALKARLVGAAVLVGVAMIVLGSLLGGPKQREAPADGVIVIRPEPERPPSLRARQDGSETRETAAATSGQPQPAPQPSRADADPDASGPPRSPGARQKVTAPPRFSERGPRLRRTGAQGPHPRQRPQRPTRRQPNRWRLRRPSVKRPRRLIDQPPRSRRQPITTCMHELPGQRFRSPGRPNPRLRRKRPRHRLLQPDRLHGLRPSRPAPHRPSRVPPATAGCCALHPLAMRTMRNGWSSACVMPGMHPARRP